MKLQNLTGLETSDEVAHAIVSLYRQRGDGRYDEVVSQTEHALQCGSLALAAGADDATVVAAFLHDIGHLLLDEAEATERFRAADLHHENVGARFLAGWYDENVLTPIRLHVPAKRYLCAIDPGYHDGLSAASVRSLVKQGGPMNDAEIEAFEAQEHADRAVALRRWDDAAKVANAPTPDLDVFRELLVAVAR